MAIYGDGKHTDDEAQATSTLKIDVRGKQITYHRNPTRGEIRFGEGAVHYKDFDREACVKPDGKLKVWLVCPQDGLRYYR